MQPIIKCHDMVNCTVYMAIMNRVHGHMHRNSIIYNFMHSIYKYYEAIYNMLLLFLDGTLAALSGRWIAAHPWLVLKGDWGRRISTGIDGLRGWKSAIEHRSRVRAFFPCRPILSDLWSSLLTTGTLALPSDPCHACSGLGMLHSGLVHSHGSSLMRLWGPEWL